MKITVDPSGQGDFVTVQSAIDSIPEQSDCLVIIEIKKVFTVKNQHSFIETSHPYDRCRTEETILTYSDNAHTLDEDGQPLGTFRSGSFYICADDFSAEQLTIRNDSGPGTGQAVALYRCRPGVLSVCKTRRGSRYALCVRRTSLLCRMLYRGRCRFYIWAGNGRIRPVHHHRKRSGGYLTAANTPEEAEFGYVFIDCKISGAPGVENVYLGRPWRAYANVVFIRSEMDGSVHPQGWHNWNQPDREETSRYAEFGAAAPERSFLAGCMVQALTEAEAKRFTIEQVLSGQDRWFPLYSPGTFNRTKG